MARWLGFDPENKALQLTCLFERANRNFDETKLAGTLSMAVTDAFDTAWVKDLLYKLSVLNFCRTW
jgi:hypothetical protein